MKARNWMIAAGAALGLVGTMTCSALAEHYDDGMYPQTAAALKGKTVAYVPIAMGFDLTQAWAAALQHAANQWGFKVVIRDPNWDVNAGVQALSQLISEKPDMIVVQPADPQSYVRLINKAMQSGIKVVEINMKSLTKSDAYVGADWYQVAGTEMDMLQKLCSTKKGNSGKVALISGIPTNPGMMIGMQAINDKFAAYPDLKLVANQSADYDPTKAHDVTATVLKQHPDLCGIYGVWDGQDVGTAAAIKEAGKTGSVHLVSSGGGRRDAACDNVANGTFSAYITYDGKEQGRDLVNTVEMLLQSDAKPGASPFALYSPLTILTKDSMTPGSCWTVDEIKANGS
jgi:ABC-type sugar transport system substrate-binding protein